MKPLGEQQLLDALSILDTKLGDARIWSSLQTVHELSRDHEEERYDLRDTHRIVLSGQQGDRVIRVALENPTSEELLASAKRISNQRIAKTAPEQMAQSSHGPHVGYELSDYRTPLRRIFHDAQDHGSSRIIYREAYLQSTHSRTRLLSRSQDLRVEAHRSRGGLVMGTWTGGALATGEAQVSGLGGPALVRLTSTQLETAADDALAHLHARRAPSGDLEVLLCPEAAAMFAHHCIAHPSAVFRAAQTGPAHVVDDPSSGYGGLLVDDEGVASQPQLLLGLGTGVSLLPQGRMRFDAQAQLRLAPTHVRVSLGTSDLTELVSRIKNGVLLQGPTMCTLDSRGEKVSLLASRGHEIRNGRFTGRVFSHTLSSFLMRDFLSTTAALGNEVRAISFHHDGIASSAEAPYWLGSARVEAA